MKTYKIKRTAVEIFHVQAASKKDALYVYDMEQPQLISATVKRRVSILTNPDKP